MPIYEYQCSKCGQVEEVLQKFSDKPLTKCGHCKGKLHKLISQNSFHLKGTGWYVTDYADKSKNPTPPSGTDKPTKEKETKETKSSKKNSDNSKKKASKDSKS